MLRVVFRSGNSWTPAISAAVFPGVAMSVCLLLVWRMG